MRIRAAVNHVFTALKMLEGIAREAQIRECGARPDGWWPMVVLNFVFSMCYSQRTPRNLN